MKSWEEELLRLMCGDTASAIETEKIMKLKRDNMPSSLFKYRGVSEYSKDNFQNDTLWCSNATDFNDPYDSSLCFDLSNEIFDKRVIETSRFKENLKTIDEFSPSEEQINALMNSDNPIGAMVEFAASVTGLSINDDARDEAEAVLKLLVGQTMKDVNLAMSKQFQESFKICSLSERYESILMWSHYADFHRGFVLEYDFSKKSNADEFYRLLWPVVYKNNLIDISKMLLPSENKPQFNHFFGILASMHKALDWGYEKEWRLILPLGSEIPPFNRPVRTPKAIYLGSRISEDNKNDLIAIAREKKVTVYQMTLEHNMFKMNKYTIR